MVVFVAVPVEVEVEMVGVAVVAVAVLGVAVVDTAVERFTEAVQGIDCGELLEAAGG